jgi:hypothetical protein
MTHLKLAAADAELFSGGPSLARDAESIHRARRRKDSIAEAVLGLR